MYIKEKRITEIQVYMNGSDDVDTFTVAESEAVINAWASFVAVIGHVNKIKAIKMVRNEFDCGLRESKAFVEDAMRNF